MRDTPQSLHHTSLKVLVFLFTVCDAYAQEPLPLRKLPRSMKSGHVTPTSGGNCSVEALVHSLGFSFVKGIIDVQRKQGRHLMLSQSP